jgi:hypothetical protein
MRWLCNFVLVGVVVSVSAVMASADLRMLWQDGGARTPLSAPANIGARRTLYGGEYYSGYDTGVITVWDADTGTLTQKQPSGMSWVVSPDGKWLAVLYLARGFLTGEYIIRIFSLPDFRESLRLPITGSFLHIQFSEIVSISLFCVRKGLSVWRFRCYGRGTAAHSIAGHMW